jgi:hypothetical protein
LNADAVYYSGSTGFMDIVLKDQRGDNILHGSVPKCLNGVSSDASCFFSVSFGGVAEISSISFTFVPDGNGLAKIRVSFTVGATAMGSYTATVKLKNADGTEGSAISASGASFTVPRIVSVQSTFSVTSPVAYGTSGSLKIYLRDQGGNVINANDIPDCRTGVDANADCFFVASFSSLKIHSPVYSLNAGSDPAETTVAFTIDSDAVGTYEATVEHNCWRIQGII